MIDVVESVADVEFGVKALENERVTAWQQLDINIIRALRQIEIVCSQLGIKYVYVLLNFISKSTQLSGPLCPWQCFEIPDSFPILQDGDFLGDFEDEVRSALFLFHSPFAQV